jgi:hypothetical protein
MMGSEYTAWLGTLGPLRADMPMVVRGQRIDHLVTFPGDVSAFDLYGTVKAAPNSTAELAIFDVGAPDTALNPGFTTWAISLTGAATGGLPTSDANGGLDLFIYDFLLEIDGEPRRIFGGLFPVSGFVTEPA